MKRSLRDINWYKWRILSVLGASGLLLLLQFQNCAPAGRASLSSRAEDGSPVSVINPIDTSSSVRFSQNKITLHDSVETVVLSGECDQVSDGAVLGWDVNDRVGRGFAQGRASCEQGRFQVEVAPTQELQCGEDYEVSVRLEDGTEGRAEISRRCSPDSESTASVAAKATEPRLTCSHESRSNVCQTACYDSQGILQSETLTDPVNCQQ